MSVVSNPVGNREKVLGLVPFCNVKTCFGCEISIAVRKSVIHYVSAFLFYQLCLYVVFYYFVCFSLKLCFVPTCFTCGTVCVCACDCRKCFTKCFSNCCEREKLKEKMECGHYWLDNCDLFIAVTTPTHTHTATASRPTHIHIYKALHICVHTYIYIDR